MPPITTLPHNPIRIIDVTPANFWSHVGALAPFAIVFAAIIALVGVLLAQRAQRKQSGSDQWWTRLAWAVEMCGSENATEREIGFLTVPKLATSKRAEDEEQRIIEDVLTRLMADRGGPTT